MKLWPIFLVISSICISHSYAEKPLSFRKMQLTDKYYSEGISAGDINKDGKPDVIFGPYWFEGPELKKKHAFMTPKAFPNDRGYSNQFFSFVDDFDRDGWNDILVVGLPGTSADWFRNPGNPDQSDKAWEKHVAFPAVDNESPAYLDINGDGKKEIICSFGKRLGYIEPNWESPTDAWKFTPISPEGRWHRFTHGLGAGDVNGDGRLDILTSTEWWEQPASGNWKRHPFVFSKKRGGAQMFAYDFDGDGDNDIITSLDAHGWGLCWFEQVKESGKITFKRHVIMGDKPDTKPFGVQFSQLHAIELLDVDGDGLRDIVTGKCYWAHNGADPGARQPAVVYAFLTRRSDNKVSFEPVEVDKEAGVGRQVTVADLNGDKRLDIITGNKKGAHIFFGK